MNLSPSSVLARVLFAAALAGCAGEPEVPTRPPDVFLVSIDTLRADHLGSYGHSRDTAPFLDRLADEGIRIEDAVVATHGTTPSHASILTSTPQEVHGVGLWGRTDDRVPAALPNLPELFRDQGYRTIAVTGGGNVGRKFGFARGFDVYDDKARGVLQGRERLLAHLADGRPDEPVFVFFHTYEVHSPYAPPAEIEGRFGHLDSDFETTSERLVSYANRAAELTPNDLELSAHATTRASSMPIGSWNRSSLRCARRDGWTWLSSQSRRTTARSSVTTAAWSTATCSTTSCSGCR